MPDLSKELFTPSLSTWLVPLTRRSLIRVLAGGVLMPRCGSNEGGLPVCTVDAWKERVPLLPPGDNRRSDIQVALRIREDGSNVTVRKDRSEGNSLPEAGFAGCIPVGNITEIVFRDEDDRQEFLLREFDNMPVDPQLLMPLPNSWGKPTRLPEKFSIWPIQ